MEAFHSLHFLCVYIYAYPSADTISSISAVDAVIFFAVGVCGLRSFGERKCSQCREARYIVTWRYHHHVGISICGGRTVQARTGGDRWILSRSDRWSGAPSCARLFRPLLPWEVAPQLRVSAFAMVKSSDEGGCKFKKSTVSIWLFLNFRAKPWRGIQGYRTCTESLSRRSKRTSAKAAQTPRQCGLEGSRSGKTRQSAVEHTTFTVFRRKACARARSLHQTKQKFSDRHRLNLAERLSSKCWSRWYWKLFQKINNAWSPPVHFHFYADEKDCSILLTSNASSFL